METFLTANGNFFYICFKNFYKDSSKQFLAFYTQNFSEKSHYFFTYGDKVFDYDQRLSEHVIKFSSNKKVHRTIDRLIWAVMFLGKTARLANVSSPEVSDFAGAASGHTDETIPKLANVVGTGENIFRYTANVNLDGHNSMNNVNNIAN